MVNFSILISNLEVIGPGGLFDIDATLPLVAVQFLLLMVILNVILYTPLLSIIAKRNQYIFDNLAKASDMLTKANDLTSQYEQELISVRKESQIDIKNSQKIYKEILEDELGLSKKRLDVLLDSKIADLLTQKSKSLENLEDSIDSLCMEIQNKLRI
jgi:F-type H+-transporting ATPase subunit b